MIKDVNTVSIIEFLQSRQVRIAATVVFAVGSLWMLILILLALITPAPKISTDGIATGPAGQNLRWDWFPTQRQPVIEEPEETTEDLARATIRAELLGVVISEEGSYAAISTSKNPDAVYAVGDTIENNVSLEEIQATRVIVSQRGSRRQIPLKSLDEKRGNRSESDALIEVNPSASSSGQGFNLSGLVSTTPVQVAGGGIGLKLGNMSDDLTDLADVQEGDIVLAVNGTAIGEMMTNPLLWQQFTQQTNMPITIMRGDEQIELFVNAASLSEKILPRIGAGQVQ